MDRDALRERIIDGLKTVYDPEIPVDVYNLGLIYQVDVDEEAKASIRMTLTAPNCPAAELLPGLVEQTAREVDGISEVRVDLVFDPPWDKDLMSPAARLKLGMM